MKYISVNVGNIIIGNGIRPIVVQSMCNTDTNDIEGTVQQCREMAGAGCSMIRITTQGLKEVASLALIKNELRKEGIMTPLVADVHFNSEVAIAVAAVADKVRINPVISREAMKRHKRSSKNFWKSAENMAQQSE